MTFKELIHKRESTRLYLETKVEREKIEACIDAARLAPSACNAQPWKFIVVDEENKLKDLSKNIYDPLVSGINKFALKCPCFIVIARQKRNLTSAIGGLLKHKDYTPIDIGIAAEHICLQATDIGLGTCIIGWFKEKQIKKILNIPNNVNIELIVAIGYGENNLPRKKIRKNFEEIISYNNY